MKAYGILGIVAMGAAIASAITFGVSAVKADYEYERTISSYWNLADKASALDKKSEYLDKYVTAIESANLSGNDATIFPTPDNAYDQNFSALKSLQQRMHEIQSMDVRSFEYQQAISQITAQEQGEANKMLDVFEGCWYLQHHYYLWGWHALLSFLGFVAMFIVGFGIAAVADE